MCIRDSTEIAVLNQQAAIDAFEIEAGDASIPLAADQYADVLLSGADLLRFFASGWRDDHFDELARDDRLRGFSIQLAVKGNDAVFLRMEEVIDVYKRQATLHALHYHQTNVQSVQANIAQTEFNAEFEPLLDDLLTLSLIHIFYSPAMEVVFPLIAQGF